jgi:hypothetical protein
MSEPKQADVVKLIVSIFSAESEILQKTVETMGEQYGKMDFISSLLPFHFTRYYADEIGLLLVRRFASFERLIRPESLPSIKLFTNKVERQTMINGQRTVNIDPGYVSQAHLILATGKGYTHRPYLHDGIYADLTLIYQDRTFKPLPWTYPDYAEKKCLDMFNKIRKVYIMQLKFLKSFGKIV